MQTLLGIWAHPDDEAYLSGGMMAAARDRGDRVVCVTATRGELGTPDPVAWPPERLAAEREGELARCLAVLGVTEHHWLGYTDGTCADVPAGEAVDRLAAIVAEVRPDTVVTFGPDGQTGHPDHRAVSGWATKAVRRVAPRARLLYSAVGESWATRWQGLNEKFSVFQPGFPVTVRDDDLAVHLRLDGDALARKVRALTEQTTQTAGLIEAMGRTTYAEWAEEEAFVEA